MRRKKTTQETQQTQLAVDTDDAAAKMQGFRLFYSVASAAFVALRASRCVG